MNKDEYTHIELDYDGNYYSFTNTDVKTYDYKDERLNKVIEKWKNSLKQKLYIIGNYIYFTINKDKFYISLSSTSDEWTHINEILNDFNNCGCMKVKYEKGRLD